MNILESINSAISSVFSNKMRTFLTLIGIMIGVSSVISITSIGKGFEKTISGEFEQLNSGALQIFPFFGDTSASLNFKDIENLRNHKNVKYISGYDTSRGNLTLKNPTEEKSYSIIGFEPEFAIMQKNFFDMKYGRVVSEKENENKAKVAIIDEKTAIDVFGRTDVLNEEINLYINGTDYKFKVIGVTKIGKNDFFKGTIKIPLKTLLEIYNRDTFQMLYVELNNTENIGLTQKELLRIIAANHRVTDDKYLSISNMDQANQVKKIINTFTMFVSFVAGISLLVGGIGIMNIMLVTVTERTREIGIRKSIGATDNEIKIQFLIESIFLCALGSVIGIIFGYIGGNTLANILRPIVGITGMTLGEPIFSISISLGAMIVSVGIGIIFGVYPASKAAKLDPIEALRYE